MKNRMTPKVEETPNDAARPLPPRMAPRRRASRDGLALAALGQRFDEAAEAADRLDRPRLARLLRAGALEIMG